MNGQPNRTSWHGKSVAVIGGTGFLGFQIVRCLHDAGAIVRSISLPPPPGHPIQEFLAIAIQTADLCDPAAARSALDGCEVIFLAAGPVGGATRQRSMDVHARLTQSVLDARPAGSLLVHTSSIVTLGATTRRDRRTEDSPFNLEGLAVPYVHGKRAAEQLALAAERTITVNPGYLFGPEDYSGSVMGRFCHRFWRGMMPMTSTGGINAVDVRDVARGHLLAAEHGRSGQRYILGGDNVSFHRLLKHLAAAARIQPRRIPRLPHWTMMSIAAGASALGWWKGKEPFPSFEDARIGRRFWYASSDKAERELGFRARPLADTLADAFAWHAGQTRYRFRGVRRWWFRPAA